MALHAPPHVRASPTGRLRHASRHAPVFQSSDVRHRPPSFRVEPAVVLWRVQWHPGVETVSPGGGTVRYVRMYMVHTYRHLPHVALVRPPSSAAVKDVSRPLSDAAKQPRSGSHRTSAVAAYVLLRTSAKARTDARRRRDQMRLWLGRHRRLSTFVSLSPLLGPDAVLSHLLFFPLVNTYVRTVRTYVSAYILYRGITYNLNLPSPAHAFPSFPPFYRQPARCESLSIHWPPAHPSLPPPPPPPASTPYGALGFLLLPRGKETEIDRPQESSHRCRRPRRVLTAAVLSQLQGT